jgi:hypothetical protein
MKTKLLFTNLLLLSLLANNASSAQTVVYDVPLADLVNQASTCSTVPNDATYKVSSNTSAWGFSWLSTGPGTPSSITVEFFMGIDCGVGGYGNPPGELLPITLNGTYETDYVTSADNTICSCDPPNPFISTFIATNVNYNPGGLNTVLIAPSVVYPPTEFGFMINPTWSNAYARVTVDYCAVLTTSVSSSTICDGDLVTLSAASNNGGNVTWDNGVADNTPFVPANTGTTTYTATSDMAGDCAFSIDIVNNPLPTLNTLVDTAVCLGDSVLLYGYGTADSYLWDNAAANNSYYTPAFSFGHTVTGLINATGCSTSQIVNIDVDAVLVTGTGTDEFIGNDGTVSINVSGATLPLTFDWDNDGTGDFDDTQNLTGLISGTYIVVVNSAIGCSGTTSVTIGNQVGLSEDNISFEVYPNPATDNVTITANGSFEYTIVSVLGNVVISGNGINTELISVEGLASGSYFVNVKANGETLKTKLVKK